MRIPIRVFVVSLCAIVVATLPRASFAACDDALIGEGRVAAVTGARSFVLDDGREVRLAQIELSSPDAGEDAGRRALETMLSGKSVSLRGAAEIDRYGRVIAFAVEQGTGASVQARLVEAGVALASHARGTGCAGELHGAEERAKLAKSGAWAGSAVIKNAEIPGDILTGLGNFAVVEGTVISVRQAGGNTYVNFGRQWTRDFAVTISRPRMAAFEAAGFGAKALEKRRIRVRGFVEQRGGPRIEATAPGQIEFVDR